MSAKPLLFAIAACAACACAQMPGPPPGPPPGRTLSCTGANCDVKVSVKCEAYVFCWIEVDYELVKVAQGNSPVIT